MTKAEEIGLGLRLLSKFEHGEGFTLKDAEDLCGILQSEQRTISLVHAVKREMRGKLLRNMAQFIVEGAEDRMASMKEESHGRDIRRSIEVLKRGDLLTDHELSKLRSHYERIQEATCHDPAYEAANYHARYQFLKVDDMIKGRKREQSP